ncbi:hypothetical protein [Nocardioides gilvus]|uniref:hypothetical protein n=1 Tax=Nocardioides gilvus TaxID=1735589 RepID=UPI000D750A93|nr:hypothetical protein [Nocardioides gilvus]
MTDSDLGAPRVVSPQENETALRRAQEVVGLYGDPDVTWGISLELSFAEPVDLTGAPARLTTMVREHPHLGPVPSLRQVPAQEWDRVREESASADFGDGRLVRLLARSDARTFFVTAHHGVCDGLGLVAIASSLVGRELSSSARGVGERRSSRSFLTSSIVRLGEALVSPPARFGGTRNPARVAEPESLLQESATRWKVNGTTVCTALTKVYAAWPRGRSRGGRRFLVVMGASRRAPGDIAPDRRTAYLRIPLKLGWDEARVKAAIRAVEPEPDFPETSAGGVGPMVMRALKNRLGYTVNVSNLGLVTGDGLESLAMFPAVNGPQAVGIGLVSTPLRTTVSVRTRRSDFSEDEARLLLRRLVEEMG